MRQFIYSFSSEWLKKKRSAAAWLTIIGGFFIPAIIFIARLTDMGELYHTTVSEYFWERLANKCWQFMAIFLLPLGVILATSLITQLEYRSNAWKQLHTTPQSYPVIFLAKFAVIFSMMLQFFLLFNVGIYLAGALPAVFFRGIPYPVQPIPFHFLFGQSLRYFIDCLPIIALQYLLGLQFKNFMVSLGVGLGLFVASMIALVWKYAYLVPYAYCTLYFESKHTRFPPGVNIHVNSLAYFAVFVVAAYILYIRKKEKG